MSPGFSYGRLSLVEGNRRRGEGESPSSESHVAAHRPSAGAGRSERPGNHKHPRPSGACDFPVSHSCRRAERGAANLLSADVLGLLSFFLPFSPSPVAFHRREAPQAVAMTASRRNDRKGAARARIAAMKLRCQPSSIRLRFLTWMMAPPRIGDAVGNVDVHDDARLHSLTKLEHRGFADSGVDVVVVEGVDAQREDDRLRVASSRRNGGDMEGRGFIDFAHGRPTPDGSGSAPECRLFRTPRFRNDDRAG